MFTAGFHSTTLTSGDRTRVPGSVNVCVLEIHAAVAWCRPAFNPPPPFSQRCGAHQRPGTIVRVTAAAQPHAPMWDTGGRGSAQHLQAQQTGHSRIPILTHRAPPQGIEDRTEIDPPSPTACTGSKSPNPERVKSRLSCTHAHSPILAFYLCHCNMASHAWI